MLMGEYDAFRILRALRDSPPSNIVNLFGGSGCESGRIAIFEDFLAEDGIEEFVSALKPLRPQIVREACRGGNARLLSIAMESLSIAAADLQGTKGKKHATTIVTIRTQATQIIHPLSGEESPLWIAANNGDAAVVTCLAGIEGVIFDLESPDGTNAAAIAFGHGYTDLLQIMEISMPTSSDNIATFTE